MLFDEIRDFFLFGPRDYFEMRKMEKQMPSKIKEMEDFEKRRKEETMAKVPEYKEGEYMQLVRNTQLGVNMRMDTKLFLGRTWKNDPEPRRLAALLEVAERGDEQEAREADKELAEIYVSDLAKRCGIYSEELSRKHLQRWLDWMKSEAQKEDSLDANLILYNYFKDSDPEEAKKYLLQGAELGQPDLCYMLGDLYWSEGNFPAAMKLFETAGEGGYVRAASRLRDIYYKGDGPIKKDVNKQNYWTIKVLEISRKIDNFNANLHKSAHQ